MGNSNKDFVDTSEKSYPVGKNPEDDYFTYSKAEHKREIDYHIKRYEDFMKETKELNDRIFHLTEVLKVTVDEMHHLQKENKDLKDTIESCM